MTHILQATHEVGDIMFPGANSNPSTLWIYSPTFTVPYDASVLYMDVTIYDENVLPGGEGRQIQYYLTSVDTSRPANIGNHTYNQETDFYFNHHSSSDPFTSVTGINITKDSGPWLSGDQFIMFWLFYFNNPSKIGGIKSIRFY